MTTVSIVIPVYDLGAYVAAAIESALGQTYPEVEVVVVDDGSTEPTTLRALAQYGARPRVRLLRTENQGLARARNHGIAAARGTYVVPLDADDLIAPRFVERTVSVLDRDPGVGFVYTGVEVFGEYDARWAAEPYGLDRLLTRNLVGLATALIRKSAWERVAGYDPAFRYGLEDWDFFIRVARAGWGGVAIDEPLTSYRKRSGSMLRLCEAPERRPAVIRQLVERHRDLYAERLVDVVVALSGDVFAAECAERRARFALQDVYRSRLGRLAGWMWAWRARWSGDSAQARDEGARGVPATAGRVEGGGAIGGSSTAAPDEGRNAWVDGGGR
jgi:glycosyltransferase involved in cell wall biosynthesis